MLWVFIPPLPPKLSIQFDLPFLFFFLFVFTLWKPLRCQFNKLSSFASRHSLTRPTFELQGNQNKSTITNQVIKTDRLKETLKY